MQITGLKVTIFGTGGVAIWAIYDFFLNQTPMSEATIVRASDFVQAIPVAAWLFVPLALTIIAATLARFGFLQKLFGDFHKQLTDSNNQTGARLRRRDEQQLHYMLHGWKNPIRYLERADSWLAVWSSVELWSHTGFVRCWMVALVYPMATLLVVWAATNNGKIGATTILASHSENWLRWAVALSLLAAVALFYTGLTLLLRVDILPRALQRMGNFGTPFVRVPVATVNNIVAAATILVASVITVSAATFVAPSGTNHFSYGPVFAVVIAGNGAYAFENARAFSSPYASALAAAVVTASAFNLAFTGLGAFAGTVAIAVSVFALTYNDARIGSNFALLARFSRVGVTVALYVASIYLIPRAPAWGMEHAYKALSADGAPFFLLTFVGIFSLMNGLADWASLNATRALIARMKTGATRGVVARLYLWDIAIALLLTIIVYGATLGILLMMQRAGWQVDVKSILTELRDNPWSGQSTWLLALAVTNFIPTLVHMVLWLSDGLQARDDETREDIEQFLRSGGKDAALQIAPTIIYVLRIQKWLERAMVASLTLALIPLFAICVPWAAGHMLRFV